MYDTHGDFTIYSDIEASKLLTNGSKPGLLPILIDMINDLKSHGVNQSELNMAKGYLYGHMMRTSENELEVARYNGEQTILFPNEPVISYSLLYNKFYKNIEKSDIDSVIDKYFRKELMSVCIVSEKSQKLGTVKTICERIK
jgi:predicted Zn-dependent peptidase